MVPTVRLTLLMFVENRTGFWESSASRLITISCWSSALSRPWSCRELQYRSWFMKADSGSCRTGVRSSRCAFHSARARVVSSAPAWPTASLMVRKPNCAMYSRTSSAMNMKKFSTNSGLPVNRSRSSGFWVATPTGQVSRWQTRIMMQPATTNGAVAKPNSCRAASRSSHLARS